MKTSRLILIGATASAVITTIAVLILVMGSEENQPEAQKEKTATTGSQSPQQNGVSGGEKAQASDGKGGIGDWDLG